MFDIGTFAVSERVASAPESSAAPLLGAPLEQPLVLDLDHTLIRTDLLFECFAAALFKNPLVLFQAIFWLLRGKAFLKRQLAAVGAPDFDVLPVNADVVSLAEREAAAGRRIVLATAADELIAWRIARRFPFITEVIASDGALNLKGEVKAMALTRRFPAGFVYAGDSMADVAVWRTASLAITVGATRRIATDVAASGTPALALSRRVRGDNAGRGAAAQAMGQERPCLRARAALRPIRQSFRLGDGLRRLSRARADRFGDLSRQRSRRSQP